MTHSNPNSNVGANASSSSSTPSSSDSTIQQLQAKLDAQSALLKTHQTALGLVQQSLTCQICLDLLYKPYALAPCGHIACYSCLVAWFTSVDGGPPGVPPSGLDPIPAMGNDRDPNTNTNPDTNASVNAPGNTNANTNGNQNPTTATSTTTQNPTTTTTTTTRARTYYRVKKTCPHCRSVVRERPVEVWTIKNMVSGLVGSASGILELPSGGPSVSTSDDTRSTEAAATSGAENGDPWKGIFCRRSDPSAGVSGMRFLYPHHRHRSDNPNDAPPNQEDMGMLDQEDGGIYRCLECMHEIWDGVCTNPRCGREYGGHLGWWGEDGVGFGSGEDDDDDEDGWFEYGVGSVGMDINEWDEEEEEAPAHEREQMERDFMMMAMGLLTAEIRHVDSEIDFDSSSGSSDNGDWRRGRPLFGRNNWGDIVQEEEEEDQDEEGDEEDDDYEGSFIDDTDGEGAGVGTTVRRDRGRLEPTEVIEVEDSDDDVEEEKEEQEDTRSVARRLGRGIRFGGGGGARQRGGRGGVVVLSDEDEDEDSNSGEGEDSEEETCHGDYSQYLVREEADDRDEDVSDSDASAAGYGHGGFLFGVTSGNRGLRVRYGDFAANGYGEEDEDEGEDDGDEDLDDEDENGSREEDDDGSLSGPPVHLRHLF
ncbi:hypothetical protein K435DRAFT_773633 [Dendrothele bispora CBS 962.96]|uniref:RING-type domain-containing protein n=1 Tax=Dendrothele bispora (strain CBS 962.96) TaxID=1314807 RepID=A0A4S8MRP1_DENBC|nr:hypothetical protein K435DRAFT_773633 [Dendrothele bispora CBS 962.96]